MGVWVRPDNFSAVFRVTSSKYADDFIDKGSIKFNTPQSWIDYSKKFGNGRGDGYEGTIAFCNVFDYERVVELNQKYNSTCILDTKLRSLSKEVIGQRLFLKDMRSLQLPCFCFYIMKHSLFNCPNNAGKHRVSAVIPASYFRDFSDNLSLEDIKNLPLEEQPAIIVIHDFDAFKVKLYKALKSIGVEDTEIIVDKVSYFDFETYGDGGWMDFERKYPYELFVKNIRFKEQSEARMIINTKKNKIIKRLYDHTIELGCMKDIAQVYKGYLYEGMKVEMTINIYEE